MTEHFIEVYSCGHVRSQCRCPDPNKTEKKLDYACPSCYTGATQPKKDSREKMLQIAIQHDHQKIADETLRIVKEFYNTRGQLPTMAKVSRNAQDNGYVIEVA